MFKKTLNYLINRILSRKPKHQYCPSSLYAIKRQLPNNPDIVMTRFNPKLGKLWLEALKSGKYKPGSTFLCSFLQPPNPPDFVIKRETCYCPLGVLLEVLIENGFPINKTPKAYFVYYSVNYNSCVSSLPEALCDLIGLSVMQHALITTQHDTDFKYRQNFEPAIALLENPAFYQEH